MANFALIIVCLGVGLWLRLGKKTPESTPHVLNTYVTHLALPAMILSMIRAAFRVVDHDWMGIFIPVSAGWLMFLGAAVLFWILGRRLKWSKGMRAAVILTAGLGNTSFVGFPMLSWLLGPALAPRALGVAMLTDELGTFLPLFTVALVLVAACSPSHSSVSWKKIARRIVTFPPFIALAIAFCSIPFDFPGELEELLGKITATMVPVALVAVGYQLRFPRKLMRKYALPLSLGLGFKLLIGPALLALLYYGAFGAGGLVPKVSVMEAAMAPMISASVLASEYDCEPELAGLMVAVGIPLSFITVPLWSMFL